MRSIILYGSPIKLTKAHKPVNHSHDTKLIGPQPDYFVRMDIFNGDIDEALDKASPMSGETVLNTVPIL